MKKTKKIFLTALTALTVGVSALGATSCAIHDAIHDYARPAFGKAYLWQTDGTLYYKLSMDQKSFTVVAVNNVKDVTMTVEVEDPENEGETISYEIPGLEIPAKYMGKPVKAIDEKVFKDCDELPLVVIGENVTTIGAEAFYGCDNLQSVSIGSKTNAIGKDAFFGCHALTAFSVSDGNGYFESNDDVLYTKNGKTLLQYPASKADTEFVLPESVTAIADYAFYNCDNLETVTVPDSVTSIGAFAFYNSDGLTDAEIGKSVAQIGENAFLACNSLQNITVSGENKAYQDVAGNLYTKGTKTLLHYAAGKTDSTFIVPEGVTYIAPYAVWDADYLERVELPESLVEIGDHAFQGSQSLTEVLVGKNLARVCDYAFYNCSALKTVYYTGSAMDWRGVTVLFANDSFTQARVSFNSHR